MLMARLVASAADTPGEYRLVAADARDEFRRGPRGE